MNNIIEKCKTTRILGSIGIICLILGTIMPYVRYNIWGFTYSISLWGYWEGKIIMLLAIANLLFIFKDFIEKYIPSLFNTNIGFYLMWLGTISLIAFALIHKKDVESF